MSKRNGRSGKEAGKCCGKSPASGLVAGTAPLFEDTTTCPETRRRCLEAQRKHQHTIADYDAETAWKAGRETYFSKLAIKIREGKIPEDIKRTIGQRMTTSGGLYCHEKLHQELNLGQFGLVLTA